MTCGRQAARYKPAGVTAYGRRKENRASLAIIALIAATVLSILRPITIAADAAAAQQLASSTNWLRTPLSLAPRYARPGEPLKSAR